MAFEQFQDLKLVCPETGKELTADRGEQSLSSNDGDVRYPIKAGVALFEPEKYTENFGDQWQTYQTVQLDTENDDTLSKDRLLLSLGLTEEELKGKLVLEAGSGAGRFTAILLELGARVVTFDASDAVFANAKNNQNPNLVILQNSIYDIPLGEQQFDIVVCLGVLQHTPNREKTINELSKHVKPGGMLCIDSYPWQWFRRCAPYYLLGRPIISRLSPKMIDRVSKAWVNLWWPARRILRNVFIRRVCTTLSPVAPIFYYYAVTTNKSDEFLKEWAYLDTHDFLSPRYDVAQTLGSLQAKFERTGLSDLEVFDASKVETSEGRVVSGFYVARGHRAA